MQRARSWVRAVLMGAAACSLGIFGVVASCVPADTRPEPGNLTMTVSPSQAVENGFVTADGWSIAFDRVLVGIGDVSISDACSRYSSANYDRIIDAKRGRAQKLSIVYGLGECDVRFRISPPSSDALLGEGVTEADKTAMRSPGSDIYMPLSGISVDIQGEATRGVEHKTFHLVFRPRVRFERCAGGNIDGPAKPSIHLESGRALAYDIRIEAEALFRDDTKVDASTFRFDPFASADKNGDHTITLDELERVPLSSIRDAGSFEASTYTSDEDGGLRRGPTLAIESLADYVYQILLPLVPRMERFDPCVASIRVPRSSAIEPRAGN
ncbi:MAG: hypothetical protein U0174_26760 [Polyangiaceae bacterium]